jgi:hypothetical protein
MSLNPVSPSMSPSERCEANWKQLALNRIEHYEAHSAKKVRLYQVIQKIISISSSLLMVGFVFANLFALSLSPWAVMGVMMGAGLLSSAGQYFLHKKIVQHQLGYEPAVQLKKWLDAQGVSQHLRPFNSLPFDDSHLETYDFDQWQADRQPGEPWQKLDRRMGQKIDQRLWIHVKDKERIAAAIADSPNEARYTLDAYGLDANASALKIQADRTRASFQPDEYRGIQAYIAQKKQCLLSGQTTLAAQMGIEIENYLANHPFLSLQNRPGSAPSIEQQQAGHLFKAAVLEILQKEVCSMKDISLYEGDPNFINRLVVKLQEIEAQLSSEHESVKALLRQERDLYQHRLAVAQTLQLHFNRFDNLQLDATDVSKNAFLEALQGMREACQALPNEDQRAGLILLGRWEYLFSRYGYFYQIWQKTQQMATDYQVLVINFEISLQDHADLDLLIIKAKLRQEEVIKNAQAHPKYRFEQLKRYYKALFEQVKTRQIKRLTDEQIQQLGGYPRACSLEAIEAVLTAPHYAADFDRIDDELLSIAVTDQPLSEEQIASLEGQVKALDHLVFTQKLGKFKRVIRALTSPLKRQPFAKLATGEPLSFLNRTDKMLQKADRSIYRTRQYGLALAVYALAVPALALAMIFCPQMWVQFGLTMGYAALPVVINLIQSRIDAKEKKISYLRLMQQAYLKPEKMSPILFSRIMRQDGESKPLAALSLEGMAPSFAREALGETFKSRTDVLHRLPSHDPKEITKAHLKKNSRLTWQAAPEQQAAVIKVWNRALQTAFESRPESPESDDMQTRL